MQAPEVLGGRYELRGVLGRGGMAEVRDGWDTRLDRPVAIKLLYPVFSMQPDNRLRFEIEARAAAGLNHPNIVAVHDSGDHDGTPYIVMERLSVRTLADVIDLGPLPQPQVRSILDDLLSALAAAHAAGILHRDIKPGNILFTDAGHTKLADFGIAKSAATPHTMTGQIVGTMAYLSADRVAGRPATVADDLYALGAVGYEALTGRRPFPQENLPELARAIADEQPVPLAMLRPDVDPALAAVVERAMARDPQWRFGSAASMRAALAGHADPVPAVRPPTRVLASPLPDPSTMLVPPQERQSRSRWLLVTAAVIAVLVAAIAFIVDSSSRAPVPQPVTTSTSVTPPPTTSILPPPPPPTTPDFVEEPPPPKKRGENGNGNGNGKKPKGD
ncbi:serine/threonine-protein kinase [Mycobacterium sp.]|uniref:serine/threonine-protein kinase n=1 Tax=Mycobacterium sp. TaxID=1785 RepID=UPI002D937DD7|nr:serine/threonine-protein kinase [Mycobacterium sp.]